MLEKPSAYMVLTGRLQGAIIRYHYIPSIEELSTHRMFISLLKQNNNHKQENTRNK